MHQTSEILDRLPPQDIDAERGVIGSLLHAPAKCDDVASIVRAEDFYADANRKLFAHLLAMHEAGGRIDLLLLRERLKRLGDLEAVGGVAYLAEVAQSVPYAANWAYYARIVARLARLRAMIHAGTEILRAAYDLAADPDAVIDAAEASLSAVRLSAEGADPVPVAEAAIAASDHIDRIHERQGGVGVPTGIPDLDADQGGLFPGELTILAARPGVGKTSFALQVAAHNAAAGRLVYFASLEMSASELATRLACGDSGVSNRRIRTGRLDRGDMRALSEAMAKQSTMRLDIHDRPRLTVAEIRRQIRRRKRKGLALAVVDYLQLVSPADRRVPREQQVATIVRTLKETAREYDLPIVCLCQLNRQADADEIPRLSQLRESGAIEQDADVVLFLSRREPTEREPHNAILAIAKNRNGETGPRKLMWDGPTTRFSPAGDNDFPD